ncbi:hypothetical protein [Actinocorallia longicatena]|uniref:50S ribosome-binding GTPase n=1 Tax=Actinocorallia longicatena TaxID=111803 RepID=A0ABP6QN05_9ACTN
MTLPESDPATEAKEELGKAEHSDEWSPLPRTGKAAFDESAIDPADPLGLGLSRASAPRPDADTEIFPALSFASEDPYLGAPVPPAAGKDVPVAEEPEASVSASGSEAEEDSRASGAEIGRPFEDAARPIEDLVGASEDVEEPVADVAEPAEESPAARGGRRAARGKSVVKPAETAAEPSGNGVGPAEEAEPSAEGAAPAEEVAVRPGRRPRFDASKIDPADPLGLGAPPAASRRTRGASARPVTAEPVTAEPVVEEPAAEDGTASAETIISQEKPTDVASAGRTRAALRSVEVVPEEAPEPEPAERPEDEPAADETADEPGDLPETLEPEPLEQESPEASAAEEPSLPEEPAVERSVADGTGDLAAELAAQAALAERDARAETEAEEPAGDQKIVEEPGDDAPEAAVAAEDATLAEAEADEPEAVEEPGEASVDGEVVDETPQDGEPGTSTDEKAESGTSKDEKPEAGTSGDDEPEDGASGDEKAGSGTSTDEAPEAGAAKDETPVGGDVGERLEALERLVSLGLGRVDEELLDEATAVLSRAGERMRLSGEHTVVTLAGGTGSGKSSLFNAVCGLELSPTGMRRPMTSAAHACVWGLDGAAPLLDWLAVDKRFRYARASALDRNGARAENSLRGLVLLDLPDHDSIQAMHRAEVDRFTAVADLLIWVVDPQKYADAALHRDYIVPFARHAAVTLIVLNQVDRLGPAEVKDCVSDLRRLLEAEGLSDPHIITTSAVAPGGVDELRAVLSTTVATRNARSERLGADLDKVVERFADLAGEEEPAAEVEDSRREALVDALTVAAGVPAVAEAMESAYELRASDYVGWPFARWVRRFRRDPLRMMRLTELREELRGSFTGPVGAQQGDVDNALHGVTDGVAFDLPAPWRRSVRDAARVHAADLPDALGTALRETLPSLNQVPRWWWLVKGWQYLLVAGAALGLTWTGLLVAFALVDVGDTPTSLLDDRAILPWVVVLTACMFGMGALTAAACRNVVALSAARHGERIERRMRDSIATVADTQVLAPVADELDSYATYRTTLDAARS